MQHQDGRAVGLQLVWVVQGCRGLGLVAFLLEQLKPNKVQLALSAQGFSV